MSEVKLRDYQNEAVAAVRAAWGGGMRRPAVVLPTGAGKTVVFAKLAALDLSSGAADRVLVLAHRDELIRQAAGKIKSVAPHLRVGVVKANEDQCAAPVVVASVQTLRNELRRRRVRNVGLVIVDECHHATASTYTTILEHYADARAVGFTATMSRGDGVALGRVWEEVVYQRDIKYMITRGFLVPPRGIHVRVEDLDLASVKRTAGDYSDGDLGRALAASMAPGRIIDAYREHAQGRQTLLFVPTVEFARLMVERFTAAGVVARIVHGAQAPEERRDALAGFMAGRVQMLINCMVLTEGTDLPPASCVIVARPTTHAGLFIQMVGRVLRPHPGKTDALVLDIVGATRRHPLASLVDLIGERDEAAPRAEPEEGETDEVEPEGESYVQRAWLDGKIISEEVDLFHGQRARWQRTNGGHWFIACQDRLIVVVPSRFVAGGWDVIAADKRAMGVSRWIACGIDDLGYAMAHGESTVTDVDLGFAKRRAGWRKNPVSDEQKARLARYGVPLPVGANSGAVSDLMTVMDASERIDPRVRIWQ